MAFNVASFLCEQAFTQPDSPAVRAPDGRLPEGGICYRERRFSELEADASATAHLLFEAGVVRGMRVLLMVKPGLDLIRIVFALFKIGAVPIVIDPGWGWVSFSVAYGIPSRLRLRGFLLRSGWRVFRPSFRGVHIRLTVGKGFDRRP